MKKKMLITAFAAGLLGTASASAQNVAAGEEIYKKVCRNCHGPKAQGMASFPRLAGNTVQYITTRLERYRAGEVLGPNTPLMAPRAAVLSDEDIANVATFIATSFK